ncbi:MAG: family 16 glycosylhydrolase [Bradymonadia bacterium]
MVHANLMPRLGLRACVCAGALALSMLGCGDGETPAPQQPEVPDAGLAPQTGWRLTWSDEFDAPAGSPIDPEKWVHDIGGGGWGNQQLEFNSDRTENVAHDGNGNLVFTAIQEDFMGNSHTSARIKTEGLFSQRYGRFEARIQLPRGQGLWPAFWMLGDDISTVGWPECGEIDIMEFRGQNPLESTGAIHGPGHSAGQAYGGLRRSDSDLTEGFHVYAVEWSEDSIVWSVDDDVFLRATPESLPKGSPWSFDDTFFLILNVAVGGTYVGNPDDTTVFPQRMLVDYVRVYEAER